MSRTVVAAGLAVALLGAGYWLGRSSARSDEPAIATASASPPARTATLPAAAIAPARAAAQPMLAARPVDPTLAADLRDGDPAVRRAAIREVARAADVDVAVLLDVSRDRDLEVAGTATMALGKAYADGRVPVAELIARAQDRSLDEKVRSIALNGLGTVASPEAAAYLAELARTGAVTDRASAAILLQHQEPALAMPALITALGDGDAHVRECAHASLKVRSRGRDFGEDRAAWQRWWDSRR